MSNHVTGCSLWITHGSTSGSLCTLFSPPKNKFSGRGKKKGIHAFPKPVLLDVAPSIPICQRRDSEWVWLLVRWMVPALEKTIACPCNATRVSDRHADCGSKRQHARSGCGSHETVRWFLRRNIWADWHCFSAGVFI
jgi:hypothetical protein